MRELLKRQRKIGKKISREIDRIYLFSDIDKVIENEFHPKWEGSRAHIQEELRFWHRIGKIAKKKKMAVVEDISRMKWDLRRKLG